MYISKPTTPVAPVQTHTIIILSVLVFWSLSRYQQKFWSIISWILTQSEDIVMSFYICITHPDLMAIYWPFLSSFWGVAWCVKTLSYHQVCSSVWVGGRTQVLDSEVWNTVRLSELTGAMFKSNLYHLSLFNTGICLYLFISQTAVCLCACWNKSVAYLCYYSTVF